MATQKDYRGWRNSSVVHVRQRPQLDNPVSRFRLCIFRPPQVCRWGTTCTFAHSEEELNSWNSQNMARDERSWRRLPFRELFGFPQIERPMSIQTQQHDSWPELRSGCAPIPHTSVIPRKKSSTFLDRSKELLYFKDIKQPLTLESYKEKFHKLLCWEEKEHITLLHERCDGVYPITITGYAPREMYAQDDSKIYGHLDVQDGDVVAYATQASEAVYLVKGQIEVRAEILKDNYTRSGNRIYISLDRSCKLSGYLTEVEAQFEVKHFYFDSLHNALNGLSDEVIGRLMPQEEDFDGAVRAEGIAVLWHIPREYGSILHLEEVTQNQLNPYQVALTCKSGAPPVLISGAFGTGKTCFLASVAFCFIAEVDLIHFPARVLICAHHQTTAETILHTYFLPLLEHKSRPLAAKVVRIVPNSYKLPVHANGQCLMTLSTFKHMWQSISYESRIVIITTFLTSLHLKHIIPGGFFTHILIDEGAQAREPEAVAPLCLADRDTKIIIAGDPRQVGPSLLVLGEEAREHGLKASILERLKCHYRAIGEKTRYLQADLMDNYRCHKDILKFASEMFYKSCVRHTAISSSIKVPYGFSYPLVFVCTSMEQIENYDDFKNETEADILMNTLSEHTKMDHVTTVCVMSSSRGQVTLLRQKNIRSSSVHVQPTYDIQGQEYDVLYISTCEPTYPNGETRNPTKSVCDLYVFNTAITRARSLIVSFGNPHLLMSIEKHMNLKYKSGRCWSQYMKICLLHNTFIIPNCVAKRPHKKRLREILLTTIDSLPGAETPSSLGQSQRGVQCHPQVIRNDGVDDGAAKESTILTGDMVSAPAAKHVQQHRVSYQDLTSEPTAMMKLDRPKASKQSSPTLPRNPLSSLPTGKHPFSSATAVESTLARYPTTFIECKTILPFSPDYKMEKYCSPVYTAEEKTKVNKLDFPTLDEARGMKVTKRQRRSAKFFQEEDEITIVENTKYFVQYIDKLDKNIFEGPLIMENYKERFHHLLCWEEKEHISTLSDRCNGRYCVKIWKPKPGSERYDNMRQSDLHKYSCFGTISSVDGNTDSLAYAKQAGEAANVVVHGVKYKVEFVTLRGFYEGITVGFFHKVDATFLSLTTHNHIECDVIFELKHSYFNRQHEALRSLKYHVIQKVIPSGRARNVCREGSKVLKCSLDLDGMGQMQALTGILQQGPDPIIIAGPFGTGKTRVLARAAYELTMQDKGCVILICTHHQRSADTFIEYFQSLRRENRHFNKIKIVRISTFDYNSRTKKKYPEYYCGVRMVSSLHPQIIVCTLGLSHHLRGNNLTHIFIDEAAQTRETEAIIPLQHAGPQTKIVLAGDHCQVGPGVLVLGEEAKRHGLSVSLLERLHNDFTGRRQLSCVFSLLQNYRSHSGLLMLPSALFYKSTLQCNVPDAKAHPLAPFPLVFVCSSIEDINSANAIGTDKQEAETLVKMVKKYIYGSWPEEWGDMFDPPGQVCIMTPSSTQKSLIVKQLRKQGRECVGIDVLKAYEIQGCEFTAVFMGLCETTDKRGIPNNTTKTIMNRYVFNTALTRAQYLFVAVGNPLQILHREEKMHELDPQSHCFPCWKEFIKRCIECKSFYLPDNISTEERKQFTKIVHQHVFSETLYEDNNVHGGILQSDSILSAYKNKYENIPECRQSKLKLTRAKGRLAWRINDLPSTEQSEEGFNDEEKGKNDLYNCTLNMFSFSKAEAIPLDPGKKVVQLRGKGNLRGAFHGDIVEVATYSEAQYNENKGRVLRVIRRCHKQMLVCKAHPDNPTLFYPVDKKYPIILNLPKLSKDLLEKKDKGMIALELQSKDVVIFESSSLKEGKIPVIKNVIPFSLAQGMIFVIRILQWNPKYRFPLGAVTHAVPKGCSAFHAERLLMIEHNVQYEDEVDLLQGESKIIVANRSDSIDNRAFTIDPEDAMNLDDAISLWKKHHSYHLAVHIVNTTNEVLLNDAIDKKAAAMGQSIYGGNKVMNMFPLKTRVKLSLNPDKVCDVVSISATVLITECSIEIKAVEFKESKIKSCGKLSYKSAQAIMNGTGYSQELFHCIKQYDSIRGQPSFKETLEILLKIAMKLRINRLGESAAQSYEVDDTKERECWQMHLMVEEMMIWANTNIAARILSAFPGCALLRRQTPPNAEEFEAARTAHCSVAQYSPLLSKICQNLPSQQKSLILPLSTLNAIQKAIKERNEALLLNLLTDNSLFPQLNAFSALFRRLQQKAEYVAASNDTDQTSYQHNGLCLPVYTHFTSPLRRYADIVVQRMLKSLLSGESCRYGHEEVQYLCHILNSAAQNAKSFEKKMKALLLAVEYTQSSELCEAVVIRNTTVEVEISFLKEELKVIPAKSKHFKVRHLQCNKGARVNRSMELTEKNPALYTWNITMISFDEKSSFPFNYEGTSFHVGEAFTHSLTTSHSIPHITMTFFEDSEESDMLKLVTQTVDTVPTTTALSPAKWKFIKEFIQHPSSENLVKVHDIFNDLVINKPTSATSFKNEVKSPVVRGQITCRMDVYDLIKVWMTWSTREGILSPAVQLIEIAPFFRICLRHNSHPAECFSDSHLINASKQCYTDLNEYVKLWEKVILAEAAERSVRDNQTSIIYGAKVDWGEGNLIVPEEIDAAHYELEGSVHLIVPSAVIARAEPFFKLSVGDMICVRYGTKKGSNTHAVFHFVVTGLEKDNQATERARATLGSFGRENVRVSEKMKQYIEKEECEIQVIYMSPSYRRVYKTLLCLENRKGQVSELLKIVAIGRNDSRLDKLPKTNIVSYSKLRNNPKIEKIWLNQKCLNINQLKALKCSLTQPFLLIQGPPGTGKSETGAHIAYAFAMNNRQRGLNECVLYSAPTNKAVDVVLRKLDCLSSELRILRVYGKTIENTDFPGPHCRRETFEVSESGYKCPEWAKQYALHWRVRRTQCQQSIDLRDMEKRFQDEYARGHIAGAALYSKWKALIGDLQKTVMHAQFDIVLCTCNEAASKRIRQGLQKVGKKTRVLQCIVDESGMAYEPETIVPMRLCEHVILLGDHQQLQPVIEYKPARENGLTTSLFERYAKSNPRKTEMLTIQYRMHEEICRFPSVHFYEDRLQTDQSVKLRTNEETRLKIWPIGPNMPIMFCDLVGKELQVWSSKLNPEEADKATQIAMVMMKVYNVKPSEIALMTPYKAQKECLMEHAKRDGLGDIAIATITESQGDEYGIVILSTVRSQPLSEIRNEDQVQPDRSWLLENLGFLTDPHEMNVGITRSKYGLIIIGNKTLLRYDENWGALIAHYEERKCIIDSTCFPNQRDLDKISR